MLEVRKEKEECDMTKMAAQTDPDSPPTLKRAIKSNSCVSQHWEDSEEWKQKTQKRTGTLLQNCASITSQ